MTTSTNDGGGGAPSGPSHPRDNPEQPALFVATTSAYSTTKSPPADDKGKEMVHLRRFREIDNSKLCGGKKSSSTRWLFLSAAASINWTPKVTELST